MDWDFLRIPFEQAARGDYEQLSYVAGVIAVVPIVAGGLAFVFNYRKMREAQEKENEIEERENQLQEVQNQLELQRQYGELNERWANEVQKVLIDRPDLRQDNQPIPNEVVAETQKLLYETATSIFEQAYIQFYRPDDGAYDRWWNTWHDSIVTFLRKANYRNQLDDLLDGEDGQFADYMRFKAGHMPPYSGPGQMALEFPAQQNDVVLN